ncbi:PucR family transcriptional regulator [Paenibacillus thalictri]|uniref:PucR family transcriptional regulator n=1 Tax=Paenibacillus thalictri TaxID=2527873 RepID=A0A4Q9DGX7_9BACL|nr:PucR family transcriptional regulator [Paenibacillus thalictri]TBL69830.1 PucR family transcriptional regulator [Paenibacillus thalictri]
MEWEQLKEQLTHILQTNVLLETRPWEDWRSMEAEDKTNGSSGKSVRSGESVHFFLYKEGGQAFLLSTAAGAVSPVERQLVELMIEAKRDPDKKTLPVYLNEEERKAGLLRDWLKGQLESGVTVNVEMPESLVSQFSLYSTKIPILLYGGYPAAKKGTYQELKKLLESFFEAEIILIPLMEKEWLILGSEKLLAGTGDERDSDEEESVEDGLAAIGLGLSEMLGTEWLGDCQVALHYPMTPAKSLYTTVLEMREALVLGRTFHMSEHVHLPWMLHLEKLVHHIPEEYKTDFLERVLKRIDIVMDTETLTTLEQFFSLDCNVSETAKRLYIHRNTLLYRLDKFKQETGLDVRTFNDAVLVKIALLLYKVTKRK